MTLDMMWGNPHFVVSKEVEHPRLLKALNFIGAVELFKTFDVLKTILLFHR